ncbi:MAG TPA: type II secretion system major pseudopilin GspG [Tepidisphaeraceae bacterium]|jgi:general secretion pathway protein G|nr:type II secretion system major pseudopilin GspG [Tepidisphaeraceae bacterium]
MNSLNVRNMQRNRSAFTLIELLLVMFIIAILAAIVVPKFTSRMKDSQIKAATGEVSLFKTALGMFEIDNGRYPTSEEGIGALVNNPGNLPNWHKTLDTNTAPVDPWGHPYIYRCPGTNGNDYDLLSAGPDGREGTPDDIKAN